MIIFGKNKHGTKVYVVLENIDYLYLDIDKNANCITGGERVTLEGKIETYIDLLKERI